MPVTCYGRIVPRLQRLLNHPMGNLKLNRGATTINPIRVLTIPINLPSHLTNHLSRAIRNHRRHSLRSRHDRRRKIPPKTQLNINNVLIQGNRLGIRPINRPNIGTITPLHQLIHKPIQIGKIQPDRMLPDIKPITRPHRPINRPLIMLPTGTPPIQPEQMLSPRQLINPLQLLRQRILPGNLPTRI